MKKRIFIGYVIVIFVLPAICAAAPQRTGAYMSGYVGVSVPQDSHVDTVDYASNSTYNDRVTFDPGINGGITGGYNFGYIRLEGELSYKQSEIKSITDQANGLQFRHPDGRLGAFAFLCNAYVDLRNSSRVTPYFGGGVGFATLVLSDTYYYQSSGGNSYQSLLYASDSDTVFAYQAGAGLEIELNRRLSLDLGYRYFGTGKGQFNGDFNSQHELKFESHNGVVGLRVKF